MMKTRRYISCLLVLVLLVTSLAGCTVSDESLSDQAVQSGGTAHSFTDDERTAILTQTLSAPLGIFGFELGWDNDPYEMVDIAVQFVTPPEVALRLLYSESDSAFQPFSAQIYTYEEQALAAHDAFQEQFEQMMPIVPFGRMSAPFEVISEHHRLFNGLFMRVPVQMVEQIAALDEVFAVMPNEEPLSPPEILDVYEFDQQSVFIGPYDPFMRSSREYFNLDYIHNVLGFTGAGIRVGVIDSYHICICHPRLASFLHPDTGRIRNFYYARGIAEPEGCRPCSRNPTMGSDHLRHPTQVVGPIIAIAPDMELWDLETDIRGTGNAAVIRALEFALEQEIDVVNISLRLLGNHSFTPLVYAQNLAVLDGIFIVAGAGNCNPGFYGVQFFAMSSNMASLTTSVGAGMTGSANRTPPIPDARRMYSSLGPHPHTFHIGPDIVATSGVRSLDLGWRPASHPDHRYALAGGTSLSSPHIAGFAALLRQAFPDAEPYEVRARLMNTARPLGMIDDLGRTDRPFDSRVFTTGAGFVQPIYALTSNAFATVQHEIPFGVFGNFPLNWSDDFPRERPNWREATMSSLSFGRVSDAVSHPLTVTIHNPGIGTWIPAISYNVPTTRENVTLTLIDSDTSGTAHTFTFQMNFPAGTPPGLYEGDVVFTNTSQQNYSGNPQRLTMPFGAFFGDFALEFDEVDVDFGTVMQDAPRPSHTITVANMGEVPANGVVLTLTGNDADSFFFGNSAEFCGGIAAIQIPVGGSSSIGVRPRDNIAVGTHTATVSVTDMGRVLGTFNVRVTAAMDYDLSTLRLAWDETTGDVWFEPLTSIDFGTHYYLWGYMVSLTNDGTTSTGPLTVTLTGTNPDSFILAAGMSSTQAPTIMLSNVMPNAPPVWAAFTVSPNTNVAGRHTATVVILTANGPAASFHVMLTVVGDGSGVIELEHCGQELSPGSTITLRTPVGYSQEQVFGVLVRNIGDTPTGELTITLSGADANAFVFPRISRLGAIGIHYRLPPEESHSFRIPSLVSGERSDLYTQRVISVAPIAGLSAGTYTATVTITGAGGISESFDISFTVHVP